MDEMERLSVRTSNGIYEITVLNGRTGEVVVRGGEFFPVGTAGRLEGSTLGGSILKWRGIYVGLGMEIVPEPVEVVSKVVYDPATGEKEYLLGPKVIKTSPVQSIGVVISKLALGPPSHERPIVRIRSDPASPTFFTA